jgi:hypothetical protein
MSDYRKHMGPEKLEATLILRLNHDLWIGKQGPKLIQRILNEEKAKTKQAKLAISSSNTTDVSEITENTV